MDLFAGKIRKNLQHNARRQALLYLYLLRDFSRALMASPSGSITSCRRVMSQRDRTCRERETESRSTCRGICGCGRSRICSTGGSETAVRLNGGFGCCRRAEHFEAPMRSDRRGQLSVHDAQRGVSRCTSDGSGLSFPGKT